MKSCDQAEKFVKSALIGSVSHTEETIKELRADRQFAVEYLKATFEELADPDNRAVDINRGALYRSLSPKGNPTLKTLLVVLKSVGMRLSVEPENPVRAQIDLAWERPRIMKKNTTFHPKMASM